MRYVVLVSLLTACATAPITHPSIVGTWRSDRDATVAFNEAKSRLKPETLDFLKQVTGHLTITFTKDTIVSHLPTRDVQLKGKTHSLTGFDETHPYKVIGATPTTVAIETVRPVSGESEIIVYTFEGPDSLWVYDGKAGLHVREYFVRAQ